jgi:ABC-2 type transport system ATP-binding protein
MLLEISEVTKLYKGDVKANDKITLSVDGGEVFGLLGPNGAGKTTLVSQILGLAVPTSGRITIAGTDVIAKPSFARESCSYQPQSSVPIDGLTPTQAIELAGRLRGGAREVVRRRAHELIDALALNEWERKAISLSGGVMRLVSFCMAVVVPGRIVILDEPTNDVDPLRRKMLWQQVREVADGGSAVLLVTHNVLEAERCVDRLAIIDGGRVVGSGTPAAMKSDTADLLLLELVLEPGSTEPKTPRFVRRPALAGRRLIGEISATSLPKAMAWASDMRRKGVVEEFSIGPTTLEDAYVRRVGANGSHD